MLPITSSGCGCSSNPTLKLWAVCDRASHAEYGPRDYRRCTHEELERACAASELLREAAAYCASGQYVVLENDRGNVYCAHFGSGGYWCHSHGHATREEALACNAQRLEWCALRALMRPDSEVGAEARTVAARWTAERRARAEATR